MAHKNLAVRRVRDRLAKHARYLSLVPVGNLWALTLDDGVIVTDPLPIESVEIIVRREASGPTSEADRLAIEAGAWGGDSLRERIEAYRTRKREP